MIFVLIFVILFMKETKCEWKLVWNDEFENTTLDTKKWEVENEEISCHGNYINQLNCNTDSTKNLRLINGTLAITAIHEKYLDKDYTSGKIKTKQGFTYGRFEIRAALPNGKILRTSMFMIPVTSSVWARNGQIDIMDNVQTLKLGYGIHYSTPPEYEGSVFTQFAANTSLNDFHTYAIEWNQFEIKWFFDHIKYETININRTLRSVYTKNGEPFDLPFRLLIQLGVGGHQFSSKQISTVEDVMGWKCSLFIIDYVRIYEWVNGTKKLDSKSDRVSTDNICSAVMLLNKKANLDSQYSSNITTVIISGISISLIIILILIIVFLFIRLKKLKRMNVVNNTEYYDNVFDAQVFDAFISSNQYTEHYEEINDNYVEYNQTKGDYKKDMNPIYLEIINKT